MNAGKLALEAIALGVEYQYLLGKVSTRNRCPGCFR